MSLPFVKELLPCPDVGHALTAIHDWQHVLLLESSLQRMPLGRYSFLTANPVAVFEQAAHDDSPPFAAIQTQMARYRFDKEQCSPVSGLPPFQGGAAGLLSYELGKSFERLPNAQWDLFGLPRALVGIYDWVLAWDHAQNRCWFVGHGVPEESQAERHSYAETQFAAIQERLRSGAPDVSQPRSDHQIPADLKLHPVTGFDGVMSNFSHSEYLEAVQKVIDHIDAGDIFQANLAQQFVCRTQHTPLEHYLALRTHNPAPFAGYFSHPDWAILSSSPERYLELRDRRVLTRPIKGTRRRQALPEADLFTRDELRESEKDRSENVMIVDLMRNDLSRVCQPGSIRVPELCQIETYETVTHLVSEVTGKLRDELTFWDLIAATFPGGSITGAPKIKAMEIISQIERTARGAYCGSLFYLGFDGTADSSILIRTMTQRNGWLSLPAGGGVVTLSTPEQEYQETLHKALGMLQSLRALQ